MAKGFITIKQVPQDLRSKGAEKLRGRLREMLSNPFMPAEQRAVLESKMGEVAAWESGTAVTATPAAPPEPEEPKMALKAPAPELPPVRNALVQLPPRQPQHHTIEVVESLSVSEEPPPPPPEQPAKAAKKRSKK